MHHRHNMKLIQSGFIVPLPNHNLIVAPVGAPPNHVYIEVFNDADVYILIIYAPNKPTSMSEHWSPLQALRRPHHQGLGSLSLPLFSFSWELQRLSMSRLVHLSALAAPGLTPEVKGCRITGSTMPQIVDCWCWGGRWEEGYGRLCIRLYVCVSLIVHVFIRLRMRAHVSMWAPRFFFERVFPACLRVCSHMPNALCVKKEGPDWPDHRGRWNLMDCRLSKLLLMGIWRPVFEGGGNSISSPCSPALFG